MDSINPFNSNTQDIRDALKGSWGLEETKGCKFYYNGAIVFANGDLQVIQSVCKKSVYEWLQIGNNLYMGWIKNL